jgi:hypothetical protein
MPEAVWAGDVPSMVAFSEYLVRFNPGLLSISFPPVNPTIIICCAGDVWQLSWAALSSTQLPGASLF